MAISLRTPLVLVTDEDLVRVARDNPGYRLEREEDGTIVVSPTHTKGGAKSLEAAVQLYAYAKCAGGKAYDSSAGFAIGPGERVYSPDASWVSRPRIDALTPPEDAGFWPLSPDVVIEVKSDTDIFAKTIAKVERFMIVAAATPSRSIQRRAKSSSAASRLQASFWISTPSSMPELLCSEYDGPTIADRRRYLGAVAAAPSVAPQRISTNGGH